MPVVCIGVAVTLHPLSQLLSLLLTARRCRLPKQFAAQVRLGCAAVRHEFAGLRCLLRDVCEHQGVSDEGGALIGKALGRNTMLETFHINGDRYTELSGEAFADAIEANVTLKELNLGHNECALTPESQKRIDRVVHSRGGKLKVGIKR